MYQSFSRRGLAPAEGLPTNYPARVMDSPRNPVLLFDLQGLEGKAYPVGRALGLEQPN